MEKTPYLGSVRFFKHLFLLAMAAAVAVSLLLALRFHDALSQTRAEALRLQEALVQAEEADSPPAEASAAPGGEDLLAEVPAYQLLYPDFYAPEALSASQHADRTAFLTFDDGPSSQTPKLLEILAEEGVPATFFVVGGDGEPAAQQLRDIAAAGHTLGMHSYSHEYHKLYASVESFLDDMYQIFVHIQLSTGVVPSVFRFPGGSINAYNYSLYQELLAEMLRRGFVPCDWNLSGDDALSGAIPAERIARNVLDSSGYMTRAFVLLHDSDVTPSTARALPGIIDGLRDQGFTFQALDARTRPVLFSYAS